MTIGAMVLAVAVVGGPMSDQFQHDFRGGEPLPPSLTFFGPDAARGQAAGRKILPKG